MRSTDFSSMDNILTFILSWGIHFSGISGSEQWLTGVLFIIIIITILRKLEIVDQSRWIHKDCRPVIDLDMSRPHTSQVQHHSIRSFISTPFGRSRIKMLIARYSVLSNQHVLASSNLVPQLCFHALESGSSFPDPIAIHCSSEGKMD